ncbi:MAG: ChrR family anti-sigma-E factor [Pseudomonadota bacterium]|nr:ChrR family anti-sigma-E factor [Pseudomonadota bacterium]
MESLLAAYASGHLGHGMSVLMASFLTLSPVARRQMETFETLNGIMLDDAETVEMSENALTSLMMRLDAPDPDEANYAANGNAESVVGTNNDLPAPLRAVLDHPIEDQRWRFAYPGVRQLSLGIGDDDERVKLLKIKPGKAAPRHTHKGIEATLVLRGAFRDGNRLYERGQLALADQHIQHRPRAEGDEDCICLAVNDGALRFTDSFGRVARDFFG